MVWEGQHARAVRSLTRIRGHYKGKVGYSHFGPEHVAAFRDDVIHAFQGLFHVRDWLKNDPAVGISNAVIDQLYKGNVAKTPNLHLARDLANGSKHLENTYPSVSADVTVAKTSHVAVDLSGEMTASKFSHSITVELGSGKYADARAVLEDGHRELAQFLKTNGLA